MIQMINEQIKEHMQTVQMTLEELQSYIYTACILTTECLKNGGKVLIFGNGGSAADAQHIVAEIVGRYKKDRRGLPAIALTTDSSILTAIGNDFGYDKIFERQVEALANEGDLLIGISTSGNSLNVLRALQKGRKKGCKTIGLGGKSAGTMKEFCDLLICVPSKNTPRIQEMHILIGHIIAQSIDDIVG